MLQTSFPPCSDHSSEPLEQRLPTTRVPNESAMEAAVLSRLKASGYIPLRRLGFQCNEGTVRLTGLLSSYYLKQIAQETVRRVDGVQAVENRIQVITRSERTHGEN